jgi:hypothetical protein
MQRCWSVWVLTKCLFNVLYSLSQQLRFTTCLYLLCALGETVIWLIHTKFLISSVLFPLFWIFYVRTTTHFRNGLSFSPQGTESEQIPPILLGLQTKLLSYPDPRAQHCRNLFIYCLLVGGNRAHFNNVVFVIPKKWMVDGVQDRNLNLFKLHKCTDLPNSCSLLSCHFKFWYFC